MGTKCATRTLFEPRYVCLVVGYEVETKFFLIELPKFFSTEETEIIKKYSDDIWMMNFYYGQQ